MSSQKLTIPLDLFSLKGSVDCYFREEDGDYCLFSVFFGHKNVESSSMENLYKNNTGHGQQQFKHSKNIKLLKREHTQRIKYYYVEF